MTITPVSAYGTAKWIVSPTAGQGTHTTIAAAITAASSGDTIFIRPGTYTENLTLKAGVDLCSYESESLTPNVTISGKCSFTTAGTVSISGIRLQTNSDFLISLTGSGTLNINNCYLNCTNTAGIHQTAGTLNILKTNGDLGTTGIYLYDNSGTGSLQLQYCVFTNSGSSLTASGTNSTVLMKYCQLSFPISISSGGYDLLHTDIQCNALNATAFTSSGGGGTSSALNCGFHSGTASAVSVGSGHTLNMINCTVESSNANAISGDGTVNYTPIGFQGTSSTMQNTLTLGLKGFGPSNATSGFILTSTGAFTNPTWQTASASGAVTSITGNSGGAEVPSSGNFNVLGTGSITVAGSANTETVQLTGLTNHNVLVGAGTATITNVAPSATSGVPLISQGASADPVFGTAVVAGGGTGATSFNINGPVISNTTTTGALSSVTLNNQTFLVGNTSAAPTAKSFSVVAQTFTNSGTYTPTSGMVYCTIECWGGGGAGGGCVATTNYAVGGGGGAGGYSRKTSTAATIGSSQTVTIGAAGTVGSVGNNPGGNGGDTSVGAICIGKGGTGGGGGNGTVAGTGGLGGVAGTGDIAGLGMNGGTGAAAATTVTTTGVSGAGGSTLIGSGGRAITGSGGTGEAGTGFGTGGSGGNTTSGSVAGGAGTKGYVIVTEYVLS